MAGNSKVTGGPRTPALTFDTRGRSPHNQGQGIRYPDRGLQFSSPLVILCMSDMHSLVRGSLLREAQRLLFVSQANPEPLYRQVVEQIRALILSGDLAPGTPLPSVRQLAAQISTSVITTRRAYLELEREGLITTRPGLGTFVARISDQRRKEISMAILREELERLAARARELGVPTQELIDLLRSIAGAADGPEVAAAENTHRAGDKALETDGR